MSMPLLDIKGLGIDLRLDHGRLSAVRDLDLQLDKGECLGLVGESGSGKSLTALAIVNLLPRAATLRADRLMLAGQDLRGPIGEAAWRQLRGRRVGFVFQEPMTALNPVYTVGRQLTETMLLHGTATPVEARRRAIGLLERVGIADAEKRMGAYPHQLSGGQRQRVVIAIALMNRPELLIADEPTTALDVTVQAQILDLLGGLQKETGMGLLLISHNLAAVSQVADRVAVMYAGEMVETAAAASLFGTPRHPYTRGLLDALPGATNARAGQPLSTIPGVVGSFFAEPSACVFADRCSHRQPACETRRIPLRVVAEGRVSRCVLDVLPAGPAAEAVQAHVGRQAEKTEKTERAGAVMLDARGLVKTYRSGGGIFKPAQKVAAVRDVSLQVRYGEILAVVGESGCGKSTLARMLLGLETPDAGEILLDGRPAAAMHRQARARAIQLVFQDPYASLNPGRSVRAIVRRPLDLLDEGTARDRDDRVAELLTAVGLPARLHGAVPARLSGGQRQRVAIARALVTSPRLIVCDEPTSALDVSVQAQILNLLLGLRERFGLGLVLISHDLGVVGHMADRVAVMQGGQVVESGDARQVLHRPAHPYTQALLRATPRRAGWRRMRNRLNIHPYLQTPTGEPTWPVAATTGSTSARLR